MAKHLLSLRDISKDEFQSLIKRFSAEAPENIGLKRLTNKRIGLLFDRPSTRTRLSFYGASLKLGAFPIEIHKEELQLVTGESIVDMARILPQYLDALIIRTRSTSELNVYASQTKMAVINALTDEEHPTQAIADLLAIHEAFGTFNDVRVLFIGEGGNIAVSFLFACAMIPAISVTFITPSKYSLPYGILNEAMNLGQNVEKRIHENHDPNSLPSNIDVVYTTRWRSMGEEKSESNWIKHFQGFQVTSELLQAVQGKRRPLLMHDLPAERNAEVTAELLDSEFQLIVRQAAYKIVSAKAALCWCLEH